MTDRRRRMIRVALPEGSLIDVLGRLMGSVGGEVSREGQELIARFPADGPAFLEDRVEAWLNLVDSGEAQLSTAREGDPWQEGWRALYAGIDVGRFRIRPPWLPAPADGLLVRIDPRGGFGSGLHPTTRLVLELLDEVAGAHGEGAALDVGAGSGILSIAAARCGLRPTALELEPAARDACARTARENGVEMEVSNTPLDSVAGPFQLVLGNLPQHTLRALLPGMWKLVAPGGVLLVAGVPVEELEEILAARALVPALRRSSDGGAWASAAIVRPAA